MVDYVDCSICGKIKNEGQRVPRSTEWTVLGRYVIFAIHTPKPDRPITINDAVFAGHEVKVISTIHHRPGHWVAWLRKETGWWCCNDMSVTEEMELPKSSNLVIITQID